MHALPTIAGTADLGFDLTKGARSLQLYRPQSGESLSITYMRDGSWQGDAYSRICWLLRDVSANAWVAMDPRLIAIMDWTQRFLRNHGYSSPLLITSGYRSLKTNSQLENAARNSQHLYGKAIDLRINGLSTSYLGQLFKWLGQGGVGTYESKNFIHLDTGRVRSWRG